MRIRPCPAATSSALLAAVVPSGSRSVSSSPIRAATPRAAARSSIGHAGDAARQLGPPIDGGATCGRVGHGPRARGDAHRKTWAPRAEGCNHRIDGTGQQRVETLGVLGVNMDRRRPRIATCRRTRRDLLGRARNRGCWSLRRTPFRHAFRYTAAPYRWIGPSMSLNGRPEPPDVSAMICAAIDIAVSSGVRALRSRPSGLRSRPS
ncbi:Uncharacterised protein [Mycobacteroides abscessus subsp. massiliense]|nr:Uncharacterised protein [Mycobacteroides abscessus subsp. massiliense]SKD87341.1 Uncharacterised protein [Mycobacteroides abscessus subsp. massiliense]SKD92388.1 Uncharacterised protein [Mycobacteroides abscessus subsp. massiliense]SKE06206.1 Uncharacterised protein [Mycobacteroides abscessus subsp. massiliense]SKE38859.1 Uncharacterised protein [Mycobacteroides abscessus subsp. massiliense]